MNGAVSVKKKKKEIKNRDRLQSIRYGPSKSKSKKKDFKIENICRSIKIYKKFSISKRLQKTGTKVLIDVLHQ